MQNYVPVGPGCIYTALPNQLHSTYNRKPPNKHTVCNWLLIWPELHQKIPIDSRPLSAAVAATHTIVGRPTSLSKYLMNLSIVITFCSFVLAHRRVFVGSGTLFSVPHHFPLQLDSARGIEMETIHDRAVILRATGSHLVDATSQAIGYGRP